MKKDLRRTGSILLFVVLIIIGIVFDANKSMKQILSDSIHQTVKEVAEQQSFTFYREIATDLGALENIAILLSPQSQKDLEASLSGLLEHTDFSTMALVEADGKGVDDQGRQFDISGHEIYRRAIAGETVIGSSAEDLLGSGEVVPIAIPVYYGSDQPRCVLIGAYTMEKLNEFILPCFGGEGKAYLISSTGKTLVAAGESGLQRENADIAEGSDRMNVLDGSSRSRIVSDLSAGEPGHLVFELDGERWHCHYNPVGFGGWYIVTVLGYDVGAAYASAITMRLAVTAVLLTACCLFAAAYIIYQLRGYTSALERTAYYDELCGCPNLVKFKIDAQKFMDGHPDARATMVRLDIGEFKLLNQILDEETGNRVLINVAGALGQVTSTGCFCRVHDDEFCALLECGIQEEIDRTRDTFLNLLNERMGSGFTYPLRIVAGYYYMSFEQCKSAAEGLEKAHIAHRKAKELGTAYCVYDDSFVRRAVWNKQIENQMEGAIEHGEFQVYLQAQYTLSDETVSSAEALIRWNSEKYGLLPPGEFIPVLEEKGLITKLDFYVWEQVCNTLKEWMDAGITPVKISVNFSRKHLANLNFVEHLCEIVDQYKVPHGLLAVELTESVIWENEEILQNVAEQLHEFGFQLSMDDFGTGYSSLSVLKNLPVDILKIDRSFFTDNHYKTRARRLITGVMKMAEQLHMTTIAEGVEEQEHIDFLRKTGCDKVQGYYYEKPVPMDQFWTREKKVNLSPDHGYQHVILALGDIETGREGLGNELPVSVYRLYQLSMREVLKQRYGDGEMVETLRAAGWIAGSNFACARLDLTLPGKAFLEELKQSLKKDKIGILDIEKISEDGTTAEFTVLNDLDCSGMKHDYKKLCQYEEGFFAGILYEYTHKTYSIVETACWSEGAAACRFLAKMR